MIKSVLPGIVNLLFMNFHELAPRVIKNLLWKVLYIEFIQLAVVGRTFIIVWKRLRLYFNETNINKIFDFPRNYQIL